MRPLKGGSTGQAVNTWGWAYVRVWWVWVGAAGVAGRSAAVGLYSGACKVLVGGVLDS